MERLQARQARLLKKRLDSRAYRKRQAARHGRALLTPQERGTKAVRTRWANHRTRLTNPQASTSNTSERGRIADCDRFPSQQSGSGEAATVNGAKGRQSSKGLEAQGFAGTNEAQLVPLVSESVSDSACSVGLGGD